MGSHALVIGSEGSIGKALCEALSAEYQVHRISRFNSDFTESSLTEHAKSLETVGEFSRIICTVGVLHDEQVRPEKRSSELDAGKLAHYFYVNSIIPMLCFKHFNRLLSKNERSVFASLSAMVGSTSDNQLGGWYGYRASKAALNSMVKTASIELSRINKKSLVVAIHPGTTIGDLSAPFAKRVKPEKYYTPEQSATRILSVLDKLKAEQTGQLLNWDGQQILW